MTRRTYLHSVCAGPRSGADPIPVHEVIYFRTDDRSTVVVTGKGEHRISTPLSELLALLDPETFLHVHRSMVVNRDWIEKIKQEGENRIVLTLRKQQERLTVNQPYCRQFLERHEKVKRTAAV